MIITGSSLDLAFTAVDLAYMRAQLDVETYWRVIADELPSGTKQNIYPFLSKLPQFREWTGDRVINNVSSRDYTLVNRDFENTFGLDRNVLADDQYGIFANTLTDEARVRVEFDDYQVFQTLEAGTTTPCWDQQFFFDTDHPQKIDDPLSPVWSNLLIGASYDWNANPIAAFRAVKAAMMKIPRDDGTRIGVVPNVLLGGPDMEYAIATACEAQFVAQPVTQGGANVAAAGVTNIYRGKALGIITPWLSSSTRVYALCTNRGLKPLIKQNREDQGLVSLTDPQHPNVFNQRQYLFGHVLRAAFGYGYPQFAICAGAS